MKATFCGHSVVENADEVKDKLRNILKDLIAEGVREFLLGGYGGFDLLCARVVQELKENYPQIRSVLVLPYIDREYDTWIYDETVYPPIEKVPKRFAILKRNEYMVNCADVVVSYVRYSFGGASKTRDYAEKKKKRIIEV